MRTAPRARKKSSEDRSPVVSTVAPAAKARLCSCRPSRHVKSGSVIPSDASSGAVSMSSFSSSCAEEEG